MDRSEEEADCAEHRPAGTLGLLLASVHFALDWTHVRVVFFSGGGRTVAPVGGAARLHLPGLPAGGARPRDRQEAQAGEDERRHPRARRVAAGEEAERESSGVTISPDYAAGHRALGEVLLYQGQVDDAITELRRAVELAPQDPAAMLRWRKRSPGKG